MNKMKLRKKNDIDTWDRALWVKVRDVTALVSLVLFSCKTSFDVKQPNFIIFSLSVSRKCVCYINPSNAFRWLCRSMGFSYWPPFYLVYLLNLWVRAIRAARRPMAFTLTHSTGCHVIMIPELTNLDNRYLFLF